MLTQNSLQVAQLIVKTNESMKIFWQKKFPLKQFNHKVS